MNMNSTNSARFGCLGSFIIGEYELLRRTLAYLPLTALNICELVSKTWGEAARAEKKRRSRVLWFHFGNTNFDAQTWDKFERNIGLASLCLWFSHLHVTDIEHEYTITYQYIQKRFKGELHNKMLKLTNNVIHCPLVSVSARFTSVSATASVSSHVEREWQQFSTHLLLLPVCPGVQVHTFKLSLKDCSVFDEASIEDREIIIKEAIGGPPLPIKCLLLFYNNEIIRYTPDLLARSLQVRQTQPIAVGGSTVGCSLLEDEDQFLLGIVFYGDNFSATSVFVSDVPPSKISEPKVGINAAMQTFREGTVDGQHNVVFMFRCFSYLDNMMWSVEAFRKYFPKTPLFQMTEKRVVGWNCPLLDSTEGTAYLKNASIQQHYGGAVFVHLSLGIEY